MSHRLLTNHSNDNRGDLGIRNSLEATVGADLVGKIASSKVLLVGAGGIGCELLKNLALTGFTNVTVIDLDTIDVSNLNRQLLFRSHHVGQPKCVVACQVAAQHLAVRGVHYTAIHGNVCDPSLFHVDFVRGFDVILNALDNVTARRRVNRLALAAKVPLIEAGTTGYLGQVTTIHPPSRTACYECQTQETAKVYPICTIRSTPSAPVHCIVWAKELYKLLFGEIVEESMLYEDVHGEVKKSNDDGEDTNTSNGHAAAAVNGDAAGEASRTEGEPSTYMQSVLDVRQILHGRNATTSTTATASDTEAIRNVAIQLLRNLYVDEIQKQLQMDRYKTAQKKPTVLDDATVIVMGSSATTTVAPTSLKGDNYQTTTVWSPAECVAEFVACLQEAAATADPVWPVFDKDNDWAMRFVTAASNLRARVFQIEPAQSYYSAKGIAGNIIPAISTTNAIVAGLQILQCFEVLKAQLALSSAASSDESPPELTQLREYCSYINCLRNPTRNGLFLTAATLEPPNPKCYVCAKATIFLQLHLPHWTLHDLVTKVVKAHLGFETPSIMMTDSGNCIWEEGDEADAEVFAVNGPKYLTDLPDGGIAHGTAITVEDFSQDLEVEISVAHVETWEVPNEGDESAVVADDYKFVVVGGAPHPPPQQPRAVHISSRSSHDDAQKMPAAASVAPAKLGHYDDDAVMDKNIDHDTHNNGSKRPAVAASEQQFSPPTKKLKPSESSSSLEVIEIDDD